MLDEAISKGKQVKFHYNYYDMDYKLHNRCNSEGTPREYIINPYQMVATTEDIILYVIMTNMITMLITGLTG